MNEVSNSRNRSVDETKSIGRDNAGVDVELYRKFLEARRILDSIPSKPEPEQAKKTDSLCV